MKKLIVLFSAVAALAACSKNEVVPAVSGENVEISYKVAPRTKADPQAFDTKNVFASWAYYLPSGKSWSENWEVREGAKAYIGEEHVGSTISYKDEVWKDHTTSYYWPKGGKLTFFAYSLNSNTLTNQDSDDLFFYCENGERAYGITGTVDLVNHKNTDFLVADIASDKTSNETSYYNVNGVPTLFKHKLSRIQFAVKKKEKYKDATITLNSITFNNVAHAGYYCQFNKEKGKDTFTNDYWNEVGTPSSIVYTTTDFPVTSSTDYAPVKETNETHYIYIPQDFSANTAANIEVKYTISHKVGDKDFKQVCTKTLNVKDIFPRWEVGKRYTFNLSFSLDEINYAPAVGDWVDGNKANDAEIKDPEKVETVVDTPIQADGDTTTDEQC